MPKNTIKKEILQIDEFNKITHDHKKLQEYISIINDDFSNIEKILPIGHIGVYLLKIRNRINKLQNALDDIYFNY
jgi:hypothetical protein